MCNHQIAHWRVVSRRKLHVCATNQNQNGWQCHVGTYEMHFELDEHLPVVSWLLVSEFLLHPFMRLTPRRTARCSVGPVTMNNVAVMNIVDNKGCRSCHR